ncbi:MAG: hypothetical protein NW216_12370, partial [Hyphomicrobium sp.]|nr:hypothetical protein [Hyphomicrobium sp.]
ASLLEHGFQNYGWKAALLNQDLNTMPLLDGARTVVSMRESVLAWDCGTRKPRRASNRKKVVKKAKVVGVEAAGPVLPTALPAVVPPKTAAPN